MQDDQTPRQSDEIMITRLDERCQALQRDCDRLESNLKAGLKSVRSDIADDVRHALGGLRVELDVIKEIQSGSVTREQFKPVSWIAYGFASTALMGVAGSLIALVLR